MIELAIHRMLHENKAYNHVKWFEPKDKKGIYLPTVMLYPPYEQWLTDNNIDYKVDFRTNPTPDDPGAWRVSLVFANSKHAALFKLTWL